MTNIRSAKSKGSALEMDVEYSLRPKMPDIRRLGGEGQFRELDIESKAENVAIECKRLKSISWNQCVKFYKKLVERAPGMFCYLVFKPNFQPCLVFYKDGNNEFVIRQFENLFGVLFQKHKTIKIRKGDNNGKEL